MPDIARSSYVDEAPMQADSFHARSTAMLVLPPCFFKTHAGVDFYACSTSRMLVSLPGIDLTS